MPPVPAPVILAGGAIVAVGAAYVLYKAWQASQHAHAQEAAKTEGLMDAGTPQIVHE